MPFPENSWVKTQFSPNNQPVSNGHPKGMPNRSTLAKKIMGMITLMPDEIYDRLKEMYPAIDRAISNEELILLTQTVKAIRSGNTEAAKFVFDSAYGPVTSGDGDTTNNVMVINIGKDPKIDI